MAFKEGISGNPKGKPKGATNKTSQNLRSVLIAFLENNFDQVVKDFKQLNPKDRAKLYCDLLQYGLPKLQSINLENGKDNIITVIVPKEKTV